MNIRKLPVLIFVFALCLLCKAQSDSSIHLCTGFHAHYGFIIPHSEVIRPLSYSNPYGYLFDIGLLNKSDESWRVFNSWWMAGLQTGYFSFDNRDTLGGTFILTAFAEPVLAGNKKFILAVRGGGGISYHTRIYDEITNPANQFFCTRISFPVYVSLKIKYSVIPGGYLTLSGFYNHISNGGIKQPNYGMNFPTISLGIEYYNPALTLDRIYTADTRLTDRKVHMMTGILTAYKVVDRTEIYPEKGTLSYGLYIRVLKMLRTCYSLNGGAEMIADNAIKEEIKRAGTGLDHKRVALTLGQDFYMGRIVFTQYLGAYVYSPYKARQMVYQKYELGYMFRNRLTAGFFLKAHTSDAELMGVTMRYVWKRN